MTKFRKFIPVLVCSFLVAGGSVAVAQGLNQPLAREAQAATDCGPVALRHDPTTSNGGDASSIYMVADANDITFNAWDYKIHPVGGQGGLFIDGVDMGNVEMVKFSATQYYVGIGTTLTTADAGKLVTITGEWVYSDGANNHTFAVSPEFELCWGGLSWIENYDLEEYDVVSLLDAGIPNVDQATISTEDAYTYENLYNNSFPITNSTGSYAFRFNFEALDDSMASTLDIRVGANGAWDSGHFLKFSLDNTWGPNGVIVVREFLNGTLLNNTGDANVNLKSGAVHQIEFGMIKIKNSTDYNVFMRYDGCTVKSLSWALDATPMTTRVAMYNGGTDIRVTNTSTQVFGTERLYAGAMNGTVGFYLNTNVDLYSALHNWDEEGRPYEATNIMFESNAYGNAAINYFKKVDAKVFYFHFADLGINPQAGDVMTIGGSFKFVTTVSGTWKESDAVYKTVRISFAQSAFKFDGTKWVDYDVALLEDSTESQLEDGNLLANIGKWNPAHGKQCVKEFDQDADTLVYKKDTNGHTGVYFTNGNEATHGEFRVYLPGNGYKAESKGYAMTHFSFDYILDDEGVATETGRNHSLTSDGYYIAPLPNATNKFTLQVLCHNTDNIYFDFDETLINDGRLHTFSFDLNYSDVFGFCFVLWNFKGTFFMSNCHADYLAYDQALNELVYDKLKMYDYKDANNQCVNYYAAAKAAYQALTDAEKTIFNTEAAYGSARARLSAWAVANGEVFDPVNGTFAANSRGSLINSMNNNTVIIAVIICSFVMVSLAAVAFEIKRRRFHK